MRPLSQWTTLLSLALLVRGDTKVVLKTVHPEGSEYATKGLVHPGWLEDRKSFDRVDLPAALELRNIEYFSWVGDRDENGHVNLATMDVETYKHEKIINMQRFSKLLAGVTCGASHTNIVFQSQRVFDYAVGAWSSWVQAEPDHRIVLFANWAGCMLTEDTLKPFYFHDMSFDPAGLVITLHGVETDWKTATHTSRLAIGLPTGKTDDDLMEEPHISKRSFFHKIGKFFHHLVHKVVGGVHKVLGGAPTHNPPPRPLIIGLDQYKGSPTHVLPQSRVSCVDCGPHGTIEFSMEFKYLAGLPIKPSIQIRTRHLGVKLLFKIDAKAEIPASFGWSGKIMKLPVSGLSYTIPDIFEMGVFFGLGWGYSVSGLKGELHLERGVDLGLSDNMGMSLTLDHLPQPLKPWGITHTSTPLVITGQASGTVSAGVTFGLSLNVNIHKILALSPLSVSVGAGPAIEFGVASAGYGICSSVARASGGHTIWAQPKISIALSVGASAGANPWGFGIPVNKRSLNSSLGNLKDNGSSTLNILPAHDTWFERPDHSKNEHVPDLNSSGSGLNDSKALSFGLSSPLYRWATNIGNPMCYHTRRKRHDVGRVHPRDLVTKTTQLLSLEDFESLGVDRALEE